MNLERLYEYRFRDIDQASREQVWTTIANFIYKKLEEPKKLLDPAAGLLEFVNAVPSEEVWAVDSEEHTERLTSKNIKFIRALIQDAELPDDYFDAVWVSNFLEHLYSQEAVADFLEQMNRCTASGGRIAIMGPNFKYAYREYFDCADHTVCLSHVGVAEHVYAAGWEIEAIVPRFLPYSFRGRIPHGDSLVKMYLAFPWAWRFFGKQFLVIGRKK